MEIVDAIKDIQKALRKYYSKEDEFTIYEANENVPGLKHTSLPGIEAAFSGVIIPGYPSDEKYKLKELYKFR